MSRKSHKKQKKNKMTPKRKNINNAAQRKKLARMIDDRLDEIVFISCTISVIDETTMKWKAIGQCLYTPKAINDFLKEKGLNNAWAFYLGNKELWFKSNKRLAEKA